MNLNTYSGIFVFVRFAPERLELLKSVYKRFAFAKRAPIRLLSAKIELLKSAFSALAKDKFAHDKFEPFRIEPVKSALLRLHPTR